jgi:hypothetical protein
MTTIDDLDLNENMNDHLEFLEIKAYPLPFGLDEKIFFYKDEDGNQFGPYSYNDFMQLISSISRVN